MSKRAHHQPQSAASKEHRIGQDELGLERVIFFTFFYALTMTLAGLMLTVVWWYATRHNRLTDPHFDASQRRREFVPLLLTVAIFIGSIGLAFLDENLARFSRLLVLPISRFGKRG